MTKLLLFIAAIGLLGVWWWRKNYVPSPLETHYADLEAKAKVGNAAQLAAWATYPVSAMFAEGWGTTTIVNPTNPGYNRPGKTRLNMRFSQPSAGGSGTVRMTGVPVTRPSNS